VKVKVGIGRVVVELDVPHIDEPDLGGLEAVE